MGSVTNLRLQSVCAPALWVLLDGCVAVFDTRSREVHVQVDVRTLANARRVVRVRIRLALQLRQHCRVIERRVLAQQRSLKGTVALSISTTKTVSAVGKASTMLTVRAITVAAVYRRPRASRAKRELVPFQQPFVLHGCASAFPQHTGVPHTGPARKRAPYRGST
jgi:hypothetical protein